MAAARKVFAEKGLAAATARDIVRETDLATGTFYNYFDDKEDAFRAVIDEFAEQARARRAREAAPAGHRPRAAHLRRLPRVLRAGRRGPADVRGPAPQCRRDRDDGSRRPLRRGHPRARRGHAAVGRARASCPPRSSPGSRTSRGRSRVGGFQIAAHMADEGVSDVDATARFCTRLMLDGLRGLG